MKQSEEEIIDYLNDKKIKALLPIIIILFIVILMGTIGNTLVVYIFKYKLCRSPSDLFMVYLGYAQIMNCLLCMPMDIYNLFHVYNFTDDILCRSMQSFIFTSTTLSGLIIFAIAVDCFRKICQPFKRQFTAHDVHKIVCVDILIIVLLVPAYVYVSGVRQVRTFYKNVTGMSCAISDKNPPIYSLTFFFIILVSFVVLVILFTIIYSMVFIKLREYNTRRKKLISKPDNLSNSWRSMTNEENSVSDQQLATSQVPEYRTRYYDVNRITLNMFCITFSWCLSFLPHITLTFLTSEILFMRQFTDEDGISLLHFSANSYYINNVIIPILYLIFNQPFRMEVMKVFRKYVLCKRCNKPELK